jgi:hypothetical protein
VKPEELDARLSKIKAAVRQYLGGIDRTAGVFPLGALHLAASLIDVLARLTSREKDDRVRYECFVRDYFPPEYEQNGIGTHLYRGVRSVGLHYLSVGPNLALMDGQMGVSAHLKIADGRTIVRMEEFLRDLRSAVERWEAKLRDTEGLRRLVVHQERRNPVFEVLMIEVPEVAGPVTTASVSGVWANTVAASAAVQPARWESPPDRN